MAEPEDVRWLALSLPRTTEHLVRGRVKFRVGPIVYAALSEDECALGFAFPKEERAALVRSRPDAFFMPEPADERFHWVRVWLAAIDVEELTELVVEAWRMVVPKRVAAAHLGEPPDLGRAIAAAQRYHANQPGAVADASSPREESAGDR